jgi:hypothetical protein
METEQVMQVKEQGRTTPTDGRLVRSDGRLVAREVGIEGDVELRDVAEDESKGF